MIRFEALSLRELALLCTRLTEVGAGCGSVEEAATALVRALRGAFVGADGRSEVVLARLFQTADVAALDQELRDYLADRAGGDPVPARCLTLLGTDGDLPQWQDRHRSVDHKALPLSDPDTLARAPMVHALVRQLGVDLGTFLHGKGGQRAAGDDLEVFYVPEAQGSPEVPGQQFVAAHGVRSVLGFGGVLPDGHVFAVILFTRTSVSPEVAQLFATVAVAAKLALLGVPGAPLLRGQEARPVDRTAWGPARLRAMEQMLEVSQRTLHAQAARLESALEEALVARREAEREAVANDALREVTSLLSAELDLDWLVQTATDAARRITGAAFGAFFYNMLDDAGEQFMLYTLSGAQRSDFAGYPQPRPTAVFAPTFAGEGVVRSDDITADPRYGRSAPYHGMPKGHLPVRSYLAVPVVSRSGEVLGGFFFAHPEPGVFDDRAERMALGIAAQAAIALDNSRLYQAERRTALTLQQSLLPQDLPEQEGVSVGYEYRPGGDGTDVGGDWFDVIPLPGGRVAFVIGDVMGRGVRAAAIMGQLRTAIRAYAVTDLAPDVLMSRLNELVLDMGDDLIATCTYAVLDQSQELLTIASAGHPPTAMVRPDRDVVLIEAPLGPPLGVPAAVHEDTVVEFPTGARMVLFTDGLVEHRRRTLAEGLDELVTRLRGAQEPPRALCATLLESMLHGATQDDDVSMLVVDNTGLDRREQAVAEFAPDPSTAEQARRFVRAALECWGDTEHADEIITAVNELYINAVTHARSHLVLRLRRLPALIVAEVQDAHGDLPKRIAAHDDDEGHRGLQIVESLADRWGSRLTRGGKVVWAEFDVTPLGPVGQPA